MFSHDELEKKILRDVFLLLENAPAAYVIKSIEKAKHVFRELFFSQHCIGLKMYR